MHYQNCICYDKNASQFFVNFVFMLVLFVGFQKLEELTDMEVKLLVDKKLVPAYKLEGTLGDYERGVSIRRQIVSDKVITEEALDSLPFSNYDYTYVSSQIFLL